MHVAGDRFIEIFPGGPAPEPGRKGNIPYLCLLVDDIQTTVARLREAGVAIGRELKVGLDGNWQAWIRDPDDNPIELMQLVEESPQRRIARGEVPA